VLNSIDSTNGIEQSGLATVGVTNPLTGFGGSVGLESGNGTVDTLGFLHQGLPLFNDNTEVGMFGSWQSGTFGFYGEVVGFGFGVQVSFGTVSQTNRTCTTFVQQGCSPSQQ
jgi:hypothetical protein